MGGISGIKLDTTALDKLAANLNTNVSNALASIAEQVKGRAADNAPYDTGALSNSIHSEKQTDMLYIVADQVEYGIWQELGTSKIAAKPFMTPAIEATQRDVARIIADEVFN